MEDAIFHIASRLPAHTSITIHSYDELDGVVMVDAYGMDIDDVRMRQEISPELLKSNPEAGVEIIDDMMNELEQLKKEVKNVSGMGNANNRNM